MKLKKGDRVKVIAGKDKGAVGEIINVYPERDRVSVQGVNIVKRHVKDRSDPSTGRGIKGGIITSEAPIHVSNVQLIAKDSDGKEVVTRIGYQRSETTKKRPDGSEYVGSRATRVSRKTGKEI